MSPSLNIEANLHSRRSDRRFVVGVAAAIVVFVFVGFARTFYLHQLLGEPAPNSFLVFHGSLMSGWVLLLLAQATLVATRRITWHRRLGVVGACYAAIIVVVGCATTSIAAAREVRAHSEYVASQLDVLAMELTQMLLFASLVGAAVWIRNRHDWHKRFMILATLCILPNVIVRLALLSSIRALHQNITLVGLWAFLVVAVIGLDTYQRGRLHPAFGFGGAVAVIGVYAAYFVGLTSPWVKFSSWLVG